MPELKSFPEKANKLLATVPDSKTLMEKSSAISGKQSRTFGALAVLTPLAIEIIYGLTRKWLAENANNETSKKSANSQDQSAKQVDRAIVDRAIESRRRYRKGQN